MNTEAILAELYAKNPRAHARRLTERQLLQGIKEHRDEVAKAHPSKMVVTVIRAGFVTNGQRFAGQADRVILTTWAKTPEDTQVRAERTRAERRRYGQGNLITHKVKPCR